MAQGAALEMPGKVLLTEPFGSMRKPGGSSGRPTRNPGTPALGGSLNMVPILTSVESRHIQNTTLRAIVKRGGILAHR